LQKYPTFLGAIFSTVKVYALILTRMYWATLWAIIFTNSSDHPELGRQEQKAVDPKTLKSKLF
jgi:hypothetical protein